MSAIIERESETHSASALAMKLMEVAVFLGGTDAGPSATYMVVAASAWEAARLISDHLDLRHPRGRVDINVLADRCVEAPSRVLEPARDDVKARN